MRRLSCISGALLALCWVVPLRAQEPTGAVRGRVTDAGTQQPLSGATVTIGTRGVLTTQSGQYLITGVRVGSDSVRVRILGYAPSAQPVTVVAGDTVVVDVAMTAQAIGLAEVVVTGYGEQLAGAITGTVTQVSAEEFNTGRIVTPALLIQNKVAGVQVVDNNEPGGGLSLRIRGPTSINAGNEPLYVIDGLVVGSAGSGGGLSAGRDPLNALNPNDIESITVLRDASAAAIYGANSANGVVQITTKSGTGRGAGVRGSQFEYTTSFSTSSPTTLPTMLNAEQFRTAVEQYAPQNVGQLQNESTNWFDQVTQTGFGQEHNLSLANAGDASSWRLSFGYLNQEGIIQGSVAERMSLALNYQQMLFDDRLDLRANVKGSRTEDQFTPGGVLSNAAQMGPTQPIFDDTTVTGYYDWPGGVLQSADNPVAILNLATDKGTTYRSFGNIQADYRLPWIQGLRANANFGYDITEAQRQVFTPSTLHSQVKTGTDGSDYRRSPNQANGVFETYLNYAAPVNVLRGTIDVTGGYSYSQAHGETPEFLAQGLSTDVLGGNGVTAARTVQNIQDIQESKLISFFGRVNYNYGDRYLLAASLRRDGSSKFGPDNQWGTFPAVSLGWRLSEEGFMQGGGLFSDLKLRASWAKTGNQSFANYQQYSTFRAGDGQTTVQFGNEFISTIRPSAVDRNVKWEETAATNIGVDFGLWSQRLTGSIEWYQKNTDDLLFNVPVAAGTNLSNFVTTNIGSMKNTGIELMLSARVLEGSGGGLGYTADFTVSHNTNELTSINPNAVGSSEILTGLVAGGVGTFIQVLTPGEPVNSFYVYEHQRGPDGRPLYEDTDGDGTVEDIEMYVDRTGDGVINLADRRPFHDPAPKLMFGHTSYLTYRNFDLNFTLRAYTGNYVYNNVASNLGTYSEVTRGSPYNLHASVLETGFATPQYLSDYYVEDASFLRMDNITLAYSFDWGARPMRVFTTVQNVFTITGYSGVDPTAGLNGLDNNIYPRSRTVSGGMSIRF